MFNCSITEKPSINPIDLMKKISILIISLVYNDVLRLLIRQTTTLCKITVKKDISNLFSQSYQRETYEYTLSFSYRYIEY